MMAERKRNLILSYDELREHGMSHDEAREYLEPILLDAGFVDADINRYFLRRKLDFVEQQYRPSIMSYTTFGYQHSLPGLLGRDRIPDAVSPKDLERAKLSDRVAMSLGTLVGDIVPLLGAAPIAAAAGVPTAGAGAVATSAAAFGVLEAMKASRMYRLQNGYTDIADYWETLPDEVKVRLTNMSREQRTRWVLSNEGQRTLDSLTPTRERPINTEHLMDVAKHTGTSALIGASMPIISGGIGAGASRLLAPQQRVVLRSAEKALEKTGLSKPYIADLKAGRTDALGAAKDSSMKDLRRRLTEGAKTLTETDINATVENAQLKAMSAAKKYTDASKQHASELSKFSPLPAVAKVGSEAYAMAAISAGVEGRFPTQQELIDSTAFMLAAHYGQGAVVGALNRTARKMNRMLVSQEASMREFMAALRDNPQLLDEVVRQERVPQDIEDASSAYRKSKMLREAESNGFASTPLEGENVTLIDRLMSSLSSEGLDTAVQGTYGLSGRTPLDALPAKDQQLLRDTGLVESVPQPDGTMREYIAFKHLKREVDRRFDVLEKSSKQSEVEGTPSGEEPKEEIEKVEAVPEEADDGIFYLEDGEGGKRKSQKKETKAEEQKSAVDEQALEEDAEGLRQRDQQAQDEEYRNLTLDVADEVTAYERRMDLALDSGLIDMFKAMGFGENEATASALLWAASAENLCQLFDMTPKEFIWGYTAKYIKMTREEFDALPHTGLKGMYERRMVWDALREAGIDVNDKDSMTKQRRAEDPLFDYVYGKVTYESVAEMFGPEIAKALRDDFGPGFFAKKGKGGYRIDELAENYLREQLGDDLLLDSKDISDMVQSLGISNTEFFERQARLYQGARTQEGKTVRGGYWSEKGIIGLFEKADVSTIMHETAHHWLSVVRDAAFTKGASEYARDLWDRIQDAYGFSIRDVNDPLMWEAIQERWAKDFEAYLREGKAPSHELQPAFEQFRNWFKSIYKAVKNLLGDDVLSEDVRGIFDSILADDEAIAKSPRKNKKKRESKANREEKDFVGDDFESRLREIEEQGNREFAEMEAKLDGLPAPEEVPIESRPREERDALEAVKAVSEEASDNLPVPTVDGALEAVERAVEAAAKEGVEKTAETAGETLEQMMDVLEAEARAEGAAQAKAESERAKAALTASSGGSGAGGGGTGTGQGSTADGAPEGGGTSGGGTAGTNMRPVSNQGPYPRRNPLRILGSVINYFGGRVNAREATSLAAIIEDLAKALDVPLKFGGMGQLGRWSRGYYNAKFETIRVKLFNDITAFAHEAGHRIQDILFGEINDTPLKPFENELLPLATKGKHPLAEGFAEFVAKYICNPQEAEMLAPKFFLHFRNSMFKTERGLAVLSALHNAQISVERWGAQGSIMRTMGNIRFRNLLGDEGIFNAIMHPRQSWTDFQRAWYDRAIDIRNLRDEVNAVLKQQGTELAADEDPYILFRVFQGVAGKATYFMEHSPFEFGTLKDVTLPDGSKAPSLKSIYQEAERLGSLEEFSVYLVSRRAIELKRRGIETGTYTMDDVTNVRALHNRYKGVAEKIDQYQNFLLQYLVDSGVISPEAKNAMNELNKYYVPFFRVTENERLGISGTRTNARSPRSLQAGGEVKSIHGSTRNIHDPLESVIMNTYALLIAAEKNAVGRAIVDSASRVKGMGNWVDPAARPIEAVNVRRAQAVDSIINTMPINDVALKRVLSNILNTGTAGDELLTLFRQTNSIDKNKQIVVFRNGKSEVWDLAPELAKVFHGLEVETVPWFIRVIAAAPTRMLRAGATWVPEFWIRNFFSDSLMAGLESRTGQDKGRNGIRGMIDKAGYIPFVDTVKGGKHVWNQDEMYGMWLKGGGSQAGMVNRSRRSFQQMRDDFARIHWDDVAWNVVRHPLRAVTGLLRGAGEFSESTTRVGEFARGIDKWGDDRAGIIRAAYESRDLIDYARHGNYVPVVSALIPFFNAQIQSLVRIGEAIAENPKAFIAKTAATVVLPSVLLAIRNHYDQDLKDRTNMVERNMYWLVRIPGTDTIVKIRKPFEVGVVVGSGFENAVEYALSSIDNIGRDKKIPHRLVAENAFSGWGGAVWDSLTPSSVPTLVLPTLENWANKSLFLGRPLVGKRLEGILPEHQATPHTSMVAREISRALGRLPGASEVEAFSPIAVDNWIRSWTARGGQYVIDLLEFSGSRLGYYPLEPDIAKRLEDYPVIRSFVVRHPSMNSEPIQRFYQRSAQLDKYLKTVNYLKPKTGEKHDKSDRERLKDFMEEHEYERYRRVKDAISKTMTVIEAIRTNPTLTQGEKRDAMEITYRVSVNAAKRGLGILDGFEDIVQELRDRALSGQAYPTKKKQAEKKP